MSERTRDRIIKLRAYPDEVAMLRELARANGLSQSDVIRQLIRREYGERFGGEPPKKPNR